jgi:hypothetical protein
MAAFRETGLEEMSGQIDGFDNGDLGAPVENALRQSFGPAEGMGRRAPAVFARTI